MSLFSALKKNSRQALRGYRGRACLILLINFGVALLLWMILFVASIGLGVGSGLPVFGEGAGQFDLTQEQLFILLGIQLAAMLFSIFLLTPLSLGNVLWYIGIVKAQAQPVGEIFAFFERPRRYWRAVWYGINMAVRTMFWAILFFLLPTGVLMGAIVFAGMYGTGAGRQFAIISAFGMILAVLLIVLTALLYCAYMTKYFLAAYLLASDESITVRAAIKKSSKLTIGYRFSLLWYGLSFIGWALLTILLFPFIFYTAPYINTSFAMYANYLIEKSNADNRILPSDRGKNPDLTQEFSRREQDDAFAAEQLAEQPTTNIEAAENPVKLEWQDTSPNSQETSPAEGEPLSDSSEQAPHDFGANRQAPPAEPKYQRDPDRWPYI